MQAALKPVIADMERARPGSARLERGSGNGSPVAWLWDTTTGSGTGLSFDFSVDESPLVVLAVMTSRLQDLAMEMFSRTWPECPEHNGRHPLGPDIVDGQVWWTCPSSHTSVAPVGQLGPT